MEVAWVCMQLHTRDTNRSADDLSHADSCNCSSCVSYGPVDQVWVRQTVVENDMALFKELPTHLRAQVAWRSNKPVLDQINTFKVCCLMLLVSRTHPLLC